MNELADEYVNKLSNVLARITKMPELSSGVIIDAVAIIVKEGCHALNTHRVYRFAEKNYFRIKNCNERLRYCCYQQRRRQTAGFCGGGF
ncbi:MAG: hypothetical protein FWD13_08785 [Treponema sp.]|nr:hypothetical protein [Treponema sp.]